MTIQELINEASARDPVFAKKISHRLHKRKKVPDFDWLMTQLENILGKAYLLNAAQEEIYKEEPVKDGQ
jgi:hypothetical protein